MVIIRTAIHCSEMNILRRIGSWRRKRISK
nr:MAG TPA: hypothetical protein [Caudoviricetes sp.]